MRLPWDRVIGAPPASQPAVIAIADLLARHDHDLPAVQRDNGRRTVQVSLLGRHVGIFRRQGATLLCGDAGRTGADHACCKARGPAAHLALRTNRANIRHVKDGHTEPRPAMDPSNQHGATTAHLIRATCLGTLSLTIEVQDMRRSSRERRPCKWASAVATVVSAILSQSPAFADTAQTGLVPGNDIVDDREGGSGAFRTHCLESHTSHDDPLVFPG